MPVPTADHNVNEWSVSDLSRAIRNKLEDSFGRVRVRGELGRVTFHRNGHVYLDIKEADAVLSGVIWRSTAQRLRDYRPNEGDEVLATGKISAYAGQSRYQLTIDSIQLAGVGSILAAIKRLGEKLEREGLFAPERKQAIPYLPNTIGVITSLEGAVIHDIVDTLRRRFPRDVVVWPVAVQGPSCPGEVVAAIRGFNNLPPESLIPSPDVLILARGGGAVEDLAGFSDEHVVRAVAESKIPIVAAIGHETDNPLADLAADRRAPTPTAAAELVVPERTELLHTVTAFGQRLWSSQHKLMQTKRLQLDSREASLPVTDSLFSPYQQHLDQAGAKRELALQTRSHQARLNLTTIALPSIPHVMQQYQHQLTTAPLRPPRIQIDSHKQELERLGTRLQSAYLSHLQRRRNRILQTNAEFNATHNAYLETLRNRLVLQKEKLKLLGYESVLRRGYAIVYAGNGDSDAKAATEILTSATLARKHPSITIQFRDGSVVANVTD